MQGLQERLDRLGTLLAKLRPAPAEWTAGVKAEAKKTELDCLTCTSWKELRKAWVRSGIHWIPQLEKAMTVLLACITSTESRGEQLWIKLLAAPSAGKTTLVEALSVARKYVFPKDTLTKLTSGYQIDKDGSENISLLSSLKDKTFIIQDGDTLLKNPGLYQILAQLRAFYGRTLRTSYANKMSKDWEAVNTTIVICGTDSLRELDSSELGERMLGCIIPEVTSETERDIAIKRIYQELREMKHKSNGKPDERDSPEMTRAKRLTGGYVEHLRRKAQTLLGELEEPDPELVEHFYTCGRYTSYSRSHPGEKQDTAQRELCYRLSAQFTRLAACLAVALNKPRIDEEVMRLTAQVALDTSVRETQAVLRVLYDAGHEGVPSGHVAHRTEREAAKERKLLRHLRSIGAAETYPFKAKKGATPQTHWRLTKLLRELYHQVVEPF